MKTVIFKRNGKKIDMFEMAEIMKSIRSYTALNELEDDEAEYSIMYFNFEINNKHAYLMFVEPYNIFRFDTTKSNKFATVEIKELDVEILVEVDAPELAKYSYYISNEPIDDEIMVHHLFGSFLDPDNYILEEEPDYVFLECE
jgi:hypothetical protein